ncbi:MAG: AAA family ATPase [Candidatus Rokubacteria bacterium]|nr:AAA family ATPase [Candidatus Rokubacteria bacterium]
MSEKVVLASGPAGLVTVVGPDEPEARGGAAVALAPADLARLGVPMGRVVLVHGRRTTAARLLRTAVQDGSEGTVRLSRCVRRNAAVAAGDRVRVAPVDAADAVRLRVSVDGALVNGGGAALCRDLAGEPVIAGDWIEWAPAGRPATVLVVRETEPPGPVVVQSTTALEVEPAPGRTVGIADVGGLGREIGRLREVVGIPLRHPELFERLGLDPPRGVLLWGPPGCGKTLLARALAAELGAHLIPVNGPEIVHKYYGESEAHLRDVFAEARAQAPALIFFDEIDAIAPEREDVEGQVERRVVAQLMTLMDGLGPQSRVVVVAATNIPDAVDPALRRPGRFDLEIAIGPPDAAGRLEILSALTRRTALAPDVDLARIAERTHGFVGADLAGLCREAALRVLSGTLETAGLDPTPLEVRQADLLAACDVARPAAMRPLAVGIAPARWEDVGGLGEAKARLREAVQWRVRHPELCRHYGVRLPQGILLVGPAGSGKTLLARAAATESGLPVFATSGAALLSKWVGDTERAIRDLFRRARQAAPSLVLLDELDALAAARGAPGESRVGDRAVAQLLAELEGLAGASPVVVIGATSRPDLLDPALFGARRLEDVIELGPLSRDDALDVFDVHLRGLPLAPDVDRQVLADLTPGWVGGELAGLCQRAATAALRETLTAGSAPGPIVARHFRAALEASAPAVERRRRTSRVPASAEAEHGQPG